MSQVKNSFDRESLIKMGKGLLIAASAGAALGALKFIGALEISNPLIASLVVILVPAGINIVKEFIKGN